MRATPFPIRLALLVALAAVLTTACGSSTSLPAATFDNVVDTVQLAALTGTPLNQPSGFDLVLGTVVRTDRTSAFDLAFDIDGTGTALVHPARTLGLSSDAGILRSTASFDGLLTAPLDGYVSDTALAVTPGVVFVARSRASNAQCVLGTSLPRYGKFQVLGIDDATRTITLEVLVDLNCGYRGLEPGTPKD